MSTFENVTDIENKKADEKSVYSFQTVVSKRNKNRNKKNINKKYNPITEDKKKEIIGIDVSVILRNVKQIQENLCTTKFFKNSTDQLTKILNSSAGVRNQEIQSIICFGIGHFSQCYISRHQLAYILAIKNYFQLNITILFHEPILTNIEIEILKLLNCNVYDENLEGKYSVTVSDINKKILIFLPHCPKQLTNNLLWKNWSLNLCNLILINNSFRAICSMPTRFIIEDASYLIRILQYIHEYPLIEFKHQDIFNDLSIHTFPIERLNKLSAEFWMDCDEPKYNEHIELITSDLISKLSIHN